MMAVKKVALRAGKMVELMVEKRAALKVAMRVELMAVY